MTGTRTGELLQGPMKDIMARGARPCQESPLGEALLRPSPEREERLESGHRFEAHVGGLRVERRGGTGRPGGGGLLAQRASGDPLGHLVARELDRCVVDPRCGMTGADSAFALEAENIEVQPVSGARYAVHATAAIGGLR